MTQRESSTLDDASIGALPPEMPGGLTFHLPMELVALNDADASTDTIEERRTTRLAEAYRDGLVDPPLYRWAVRRYQPTAVGLLSDDPSTRSAALADIEPLADGLAGAAFHGLIRLGYGAWQRNVDEVARGLAYLRTRRQVLTAGSTQCRIDPTFDMPSDDENDGVTVFDLLNIAAGTGACGAVDDAHANTAMLATEALALVHRNPSSFVAVHAVTALHALREVQSLVGDPLPQWWRTYATALRACTLVVHLGPPDVLDAYDDRYGTVDDVDSLVAASVRSAETHDVKLAVALRRLVGFGTITAGEACTTGGARLAASQLL